MDTRVLAQSYGPSDSKTILFLAKKALEHTKVVMPRGNISMDFLKRLGLKGSQVIFMPDLAFGYSNPDKGEIAQIRRKYAIDEEKNYVAIIPNILLYRWKGHGVIDNYADIINSTSRKYQYEYILIPHEYDTKQEDDRYLNKLVFDKVSDKVRIIRIDDLLSANEIKALISFCDFSICSRFHGMVSSLRMGVIPIVIGWAEKYKEIMQFYELENLVFNYDDLELSVIKEKIDHVIERNQELKNIVSAKNIATGKQLDNLGDIISV